MAGLALYFAALAAATAPWQLYAAAPLMGVGGLAAPLLRGIFSDGASHARQGETLTAVACVEALMQVLSSVLFLEFYRRTLATWPGATWACAAGCLTSVASLWLRCVA